MVKKIKGFVSDPCNDAIIFKMKRMQTFRHKRMKQGYSHKIKIDR